MTKYLCKYNDRFFRISLWGMALTWLLSVALILSAAFFVSGCSSSRSSVSQQHVSVVADSSSFVQDEVSEVEFTGQSVSAASVVVDSVHLYPIRIAPESSDPPDIQPAFFPAYAASLYGLKLDLSDADSSSLFASSRSGSSDSSSHVSADADDSASEVEAVEENSSWSIWGIVLIILLVAALILGLRFRSK